MAPVPRQTGDIPGPPGPRGLCVGCRAEAIWGDQGWWYPCTVVEIRPYSVLVSWDDHPNAEGVMCSWSHTERDFSMVRLPSPSALLPQQRQSQQEQYMPLPPPPPP